MSMILFVIALLVLTSTLRLLVGGEWTGYILGVTGIVITITYTECKNILHESDKFILERWRLRPFEGLFRKVSPLFTCMDLAIILFTTLLLGVAIFDAFVYSVEDLVANGFLAFPKGDDGFVHLQIYLGGFVELPMISLHQQLTALAVDLKAEKHLFSRYL